MTIFAWIQIMLLYTFMGKKSTALLMHAEHRPRHKKRPHPLRPEIVCCGQISPARLTSSRISSVPMSRTLHRCGLLRICQLLSCYFVWFNSTMTVSIIGMDGSAPLRDTAIPAATAAVRRAFCASPWRRISERKKPVKVSPAAVVSTACTLCTPQVKRVPFLS